ncbi:MAG: thioredoxin family protein [Eubacteriales bacterium]
MALFNFGKKKEEEKVPCSCGGMCTSEEIAAKEQATKEAVSSVKVLGGGCAKCNELEASTVAALTELGMDTSIEHITDFSVIATYGVMSTPALVVDGKVVSTGKVLKKDDVMAILKKERG